jgi:SAM-dependent methyltransferase
MGKKLSRTIEDFGDQWLRFPQNEGYYASETLFEDFCGSLLSRDKIQGKKILEVGSGTGRIVKMLLGIGASHVYAVEPSAAFDVLTRNTMNDKEKVTCYKLPGDKIPLINIDLAISFGVIHHIPNPKVAIDRVYELLDRGGKFLIWVYGYEGNEQYLKVILPIRKITQKIPDPLLDFISSILNALAYIYMFLCKFISLPLREYVISVFSKLDWMSRKMVIFDQLNPAYTKYYSKKEAEGILINSGFKNVRLENRHQYSWSVIGEK